MIKSMILGPVETNVYFIINDDTSECVIVDPAEQPEKIIRFLEGNELILSGILLTHGHFDHIGAVEGLIDRYKVPVYASEKEKRLLSDPDLNCSLEVFGKGIIVEADRFLKDEEEFELGGISFKNIDCPGHTEGSCCYYARELNALFSGDTLFEGSVGRTDLPTGSGKDIYRSLNEKLMKLPDATEVYPGHNGYTTIGDERNYNPWVTRN